MILVIDVELVCIARRNLFLLLHHGIVRVVVLSLVNYDLSFLESHAGELLELAFEEDLSLFLVLELSGVCFIHKFLECFLIHFVKGRIKI